MQRIFRFVPFGSSAPHGSLAVDAGVTGAAATYSHWQGAQATPAQLLADTSTGILVRAAGDPRRWLDGFPVVCNNHIDADGLLAALFALRPDLAARYGAVAIAAAEAGDFCGCIRRCAISAINGSREPGKNPRTGRSLPRRRSGSPKRRTPNLNAMPRSPGSSRPSAGSRPAVVFRCTTMAAC
jgi:hypothetical protein